MAGCNALAERSGCWHYDSKRQFCKQGGSGNNWAFGFNSHGEDALTDVMDMIRKVCEHPPAARDANHMPQEVEACDRFGGFFLMQSVAGGTGSGFGKPVIPPRLIVITFVPRADNYHAGTRVSSDLRDLYNESFIWNAVVWPHSSGEVIVQSYNTLLTMSHLSQVRYR